MADTFEQIGSTQVGLEELFASIQSITDTLNEAALKLDSIAGIVTDVDAQLEGVQAAVLPVTGLALATGTDETLAEAASPAVTASPAAASTATHTTYLALTTPLGDDVLILDKIYGEEEISELFHFTLEMRSTDSAIDFSQILGKKVTVTITLEGGTDKRYINGVVKRFSQAGRDATHYHYFAEIVPWLWELTLTKNSKIFQTKTVIEIITGIFTEQGFSSSDYKNSCSATYTAREYCVQYNETAYNFVMRLMEDEGIFFFFEHTSSGHKLVLADDSSAFTDCTGISTVRYMYSGRGSTVEDDLVTEWVYEQFSVTGKYATEDYNFETSTTDLLSSVEGASGGTKRVYEYPGNFPDTGKGEAKANIRIAEKEALQKIARGMSYVKSFGTGLKFTMSKHERTDQNVAHVLQKVSITADTRRYSNSFVAFPASGTFRPERKTKKPRIAGTQTAMVVGPSGEEIHTDKYGRVKVQFHWDEEGVKDEKSSCFIRVSHMWAGKSWGAMFLPRIGMEVVVSFLEGDPDRPLITGMVYNAQQTVPYTLPDKMTTSTIKTNSSKGGEGFHELRFDDTKDSEEIYLHSQKDMNTRIENDLVEIIKHDHIELVKNSRHLLVNKPDSADDASIAEEKKPTIETDAIDITTIEGGNRKITVKGDDKKESHINEGVYEHTVGKTFTLTVKGDTITIEATGASGSGNIVIKGKTISLESTSGDVKVKSAGALKMEAGGDVNVKAGTALTNEAGTTLTDKAGTSLTNKAGTDMKNEAGTTLDVKASLGATIDGGVKFGIKGSAMGEIDGGGMLTVKGGLVKIN